MLRFLALGDSYTIGEGVAVQDRWPSHVATTLRSNGVDIADPEVIARTAWTTDELSDAIVAAAPTPPFDVVTLMIGVNDQYRGRDLAHFASTFDPLLRTALSFAAGRGDRTLLISIPDWSASPFARERDRTIIAAQIDAYNAFLRDRARAEGVRWVDVTPISREMLDDASLVAADGLHPSGEVHRRWAGVIAPAILDALRIPTARPIAHA